MDCSWAITTCPRQTSYLEQTVASLCRAGFRSKGLLICAEPGSTIPRWPPFLGTVTGDGRRGSWGNFRVALDMLLTLSESEWVGVIQDDVEVSLNLAPYIAILSPPSNCDVMSFYCPSHHSGDGWHRVNTSTITSTDGGLMLAVSRPLALEMVRDPLRKESLHMSDIAVGEHCRRGGWKYWRHCPSFVRHIGDVSSIELRGKLKTASQNRNCAEFMEDAFDA